MKKKTKQTPKTAFKKDTYDDTYSESGGGALLINRLKRVRGGEGVQVIGKRALNRLNIVCGTAFSNMGLNLVIFLNQVHSGFESQVFHLSKCCYYINYHLLRI